MQLYNATQTLWFRFSTILDVVLQFWAHFVAVLQFLLSPNAPLNFATKNVASLKLTQKNYTVYTCNPCHKIILYNLKFTIISNKELSAKIGGNYKPFFTRPQNSPPSYMYINNTVTIFSLLIQTLTVCSQHILVTENVT